MGGTLIVTKKTSRHQDFIKRFESLGFKDVFITNEDRDALYFRIDKLKPDIIFMDAMFNCTATPYMIKKMLKNKMMSVVEELPVAAILYMKFSLIKIFYIQELLHV